MTRNSTLRLETEGLLASLADVFDQRDGKSIECSKTVQRLAKRERRRVREAAEAPPLPAEVDRDQRNSHKRPQSKLSDKSFNSSSNYERAFIHEISEVTIRKIQDELAKFVQKHLHMDESIAWIQGKTMKLKYRSYNPMMTSH